MSIVIGMGTGRSGTMSLSRLINTQPGAVCFHELNPSCMTWGGTPAPVRTTIREFRQVLDGGPRELTIDLSLPGHEHGIERLQQLDTVRAIGEIAFYYLPYVPMLAALDDDIRMLCLRRDRDATVASYVEKVRLRRTRRGAIAARLHAVLAGQPHHRHRNHWVDHDGSRWLADRVWDKCYPKVGGATLAEAVGRYWDHYYEVAEGYARRFPDRFRIFELKDFDAPAAQAEILGFCGLDDGAILGRFQANAGGG